MELASTAQHIHGNIQFLLRFMKSLHWSVCRIRMHGSSSSCQPDLLLHEFISAIKTEIYQQTCSSRLLLMVIVCPPLTATNSSSCVELITCCNGISTGSRSLTTLVVVRDLHDLIAAAAVLLLELQWSIIIRCSSWSSTAAAAACSSLIYSLDCNLIFPH